MRLFMTSSFAIALMASAFCATSTLAYAAPVVDEAGAKELKKVVDEAFNYYLNVSKKEGYGIKIDGDITVAPAQKYYEIKVPNVSSTSPNSTIQVGTITINATPNDKGEYLTSMALPPVITWKDTEGKPVMELKLGEQKFAGAFIPALQTFSTINAEYKNMVLTGKGEKDAPFTLKIGNLKNILNLTENGDKTWSGYNDATLSDLDLTAGGGQKRTVTAKIESLSTKAFYDKMDLNLSKESRDKIHALYAGDKKPNDQELAKASQDLVKNTFNLLDAMNNKFEINNLAFNTIPSPVPQTEAEKQANGIEKPMSINIGRITSTFDMRGIRQDNGALNLKTGINKIALKNVAEDLQSIIPTDVNFELYFDNLPMKQVSALMLDVLKASTEVSVSSDSKDAQKKADNRIKDSLSGLPAMLVKSGSTFSVRNTYMNAPELLSTLEGKISAAAPQAATATAVPATGVMTLSIQGLDEAVQNLQSKSSAAESPADVTSAVQAMTLVQMFGQPNKAANGKSLRIYKLDIAADGKILLNGTDLGAMGGAMGGLGMPAK